MSKAAAITAASVVLITLVPGCNPAAGAVPPSEAISAFVTDFARQILAAFLL